MSSTIQLNQNNQNIKELPHNLEAEQALLGAILLNNDILYDINEIIDANHFFENIHIKIFEVINKIAAKGQLATPITLKSYFEVEKNLEDIGGSAYLARLANAAVSLEYAKNYAQIIYDLAVRRSLYDLGGKLSYNAIESEMDTNPSDLVEDAERDLYQIAEKGTNAHNVQTFKSSMEEAVELMKKAYEKDSNVVGIETNFRDLDQKLGGLHNSDLLILAGRPSMGKTSLATNIAFNIAKKAHDNGDADSNVAFFSLEMSAEQLATRILSEQAKISSNDIRRGNLSESDLDNLVNVSKSILEIPLFIDDTPAINMATLASRARRIKRKHGLGIIIIDYLQLLRPAKGLRNDGRVQEVSEITQGLKALAKEMNIPILALSQLSRQVEQRDDKKPQLSDLRESGSIEQDSDVVMFIFREEYYLEKTAPAPGTADYIDWQQKMDEVHGQAELLISKQRHGPTGNIRLSFESKFTRFGNYISNEQVKDYD
ncbi:replicative DNA helicase [Pelagibacteraceae bacterium]|nr:replicative DNA helicase [Pelagibacteraceae bacterium]